MALAIGIWLLSSMKSRSCCRLCVVFYPMWIGVKMFWLIGLLIGRSKPKWFIWKIVSLRSGRLVFPTVVVF